MSEIRKSRSTTFRGTIAILDIGGPASRTEGGNRFHTAMIHGAGERAAEIGFRAETFLVDRKEMPIKRLNRILRTRGTNGILLLPFGIEIDLSELDWSRYSAVYMDYILRKPPISTVNSDHYQSMHMLLDQLRARGYRRPGLVMDTLLDHGILYRWHASFLGYCWHSRAFEECPPLLAYRPGKEGFLPWFKENRPDVVLCHEPVAMSWMEEAGARIPETHGFCCLNTSTSPIPCAGLDLQPAVLGASGVEIIVAQIHRNEYGPPRTPSTTSIIGRWEEGSTLRAVPAHPKEPESSTSGA